MFESIPSQLSFPSQANVVAFMGIGPPEMIILGIIAVLLFGSRLPSVARSMGKSLTEFKKGMQGIEDDVHSATNSTPQVEDHSDADQDEASGHRFKAPTAEPQSEAASKTV